MGAANVSCVRSRGRSEQIVGECNSWQLVIDFSDQIHHLAPWFSSPALSLVIVIYLKPLTHYFTLTLRYPEHTKDRPSLSKKGRWAGKKRSRSRDEQKAVIS